MIDTQTQCYTSEWRMLQLTQTGTAAAPVNGNYTDEGRPSFAEILTRYTDSPEPADSATGDGHRLKEDHNGRHIDDAGAGAEPHDEEDFNTDIKNAEFAAFAVALQMTGDTNTAETLSAEGAETGMEIDALALLDIPEEAALTTAAEQNGLDAPPVFANEETAALDTGVKADYEEAAAEDERGGKGVRGEAPSLSYENAASGGNADEAAVFVSETGAEEDSPAQPMNEKGKITARSHAEALASAEKPREGQTGNGGRGGENARERDTSERAPARARAARTVKVEVHNLRADAGVNKQIEEVSRQEGGPVREVEFVDALKDSSTVRRDASFASFRAEKSLENFLARELHQNLNGDIVRQAQVMLRNNNEGTIRLALHPQSLGRVAIRLELAGNRITGAIVVETPEALRAFEQERASLEEAFRNSGFDGATLDTTLADGNADSGAGRQQEGGPQTRTADIAAVRYENTIEQSNTGAYYAIDSGASVDVLV